MKYIKTNTGLYIEAQNNTGNYECIMHFTAGFRPGEEPQCPHSIIKVFTYQERQRIEDKFYFDSRRLIKRFISYVT